MRKVIVFSLLIISFWNCKNSKYPEKIKEYEYNYLKADSLFLIKNYKKAIKFLDKSIAITDTLGKAVLLRGDCFFQLKKFKESEKDYSKVLNLENNKSSVYFKRSLSYLNLNKDDKFIKDINKYILFHENDTSALILRSKYFIKRKEYKKAIIDYNELIKMFPSNAEFYKLRSKIHLKINNIKESITDNEKYLTLVKDKAIDQSELYFKNGLLYFNQNEYQKSINSFLKISESYSEYDKAMLLRGKAYFKLNKSEDALMEFNNYLKKVPNDYEVYKNISLVNKLKEDKVNYRKNIEKYYSLKWENKSYFYRYSFILLIGFIFYLVYLIIIKNNADIYDNNRIPRIYFYYIISLLFGGHYLALRFFIRYYLYIILFFILLINNSYEIVSYYNDFDLFIFNFKYTSLNKLLIYIILSSWILDFFTIPFMVNLSNYYFQKKDNLKRININEKGIKSIEINSMNIYNKYNNLKNSYKI